MFNNLNLIKIKKEEEERSINKLTARIYFFTKDFELIMACNFNATYDLPTIDGYDFYYLENYKDGLKGFSKCNLTNDEKQICLNQINKLTILL